MAGSDDPTAPGADQYPGDSSGHLNPALRDFTQAQDTPMGQAWAGVAANRVQAYLTARSNVLDAQQASDAFVNNLDQAKKGLVGMVQTDPGSTDLALDLAQHAVNGIVDQHGHLDETARQGAADSLIDHFQNQIAHAAVQTFAETDKTAALNALDRYKDYLPDDEQVALRQYADVQEQTRGEDGVAQSIQGVKDAALAGYHSATNYLHSMVDPDTGQFRSPQGFLSNLLADPSISMPTKLALRAAHGVLNTQGEPQSSDPHILTDFISRMAGNMPGPYADPATQAFGRDRGNEAAILNTPRAVTAQPVWDQPVGFVPGDARPPGTADTDKEGETAPWEVRPGKPIIRGEQSASAVPQQGEIISHIGSGLTLADATFLNHLLGPGDGQRRADIQQLASIMHDARDTLASNAEGGAGQIAFGRFTNWLVPTLARGANLNELTEGNYLQRFAPTVNDLRRSLLTRLA